MVLVRFVLLTVLVACGPAVSPPPDASPEAPSDAGGVGDAGDTSTLPLSGFGVITGDCDVIDDELLSDDDSVFINTIDFGADAFDQTDVGFLSDDGRRLHDTANAGGSSVLSEVFAFEVLRRCEEATLVKTETEIEYVDPQSKLTDLLVELDGFYVGVSVTRAVGFPRDAPYTIDAARTILTKKLDSIHDSSANVVEADRWVKQILHVIAYADRHAESIQSAWHELEDGIRADTILMITVSDGDDEFLY